MTLNQSNIADRQSPPLSKQSDINTNKRSFLSLRISENPSESAMKEPPKQKRKLANVIFNIHQRNRDFIKEIHSLQIQNQTLLIQKDWYKQRLKEIQSAINSIITDSDTFNKICFTPPFTEITAINTPSNTQNRTDSADDIIRISSDKPNNNHHIDSNVSDNQRIPSPNIISMISSPSLTAIGGDHKEEESVNEYNTNDQTHELSATISSNTHQFQAMPCIARNQTKKKRKQRYKHYVGYISDVSPSESGYCVECDLYFAGYKGLVAHRRGIQHVMRANKIKHNMKNGDGKEKKRNTNDHKSYTCCWCHKIYTNYTRFTQHLRVMHKKTR